MTHRSKQCITCSGKPGADNPNWKGGRTYHKKGYVMIRCPGHPRSSSNGYVLEHILVMERHLGRQLEADEYVHHVNGVRHDNSVSNLELWCRPQPSGIRVVDAVNWARKILQRYSNFPTDRL
jgi:hypothetical protein